MSIRIDKKQFRKVFPHLAGELEDKEQEIPINSIRSDVRTGEKASSDNFATYMPDVIDFIRRCDTEEQAEEIITYLKRRGEVSNSYAQRLRKQLKKKGVRSFGKKKEEGHYLNQGGFQT
jgi:hypothetical protein